MRLFLASLMVLFSAAAQLASASSLLQVKEGVTTVELSEAMIDALADCELDRIKPAGIKPEEELMRFSVTGGVIDADPLAGEIVHNGGFILSCPALGGDTVIEVQNLAVDLLGEAAPVVTGVVNVDDEVLGRLPLFIPGGDEFEVLREGGHIKLRKADLTLTEEAAILLSETFGIAVEGGLVGRSWTKADLREADKGKNKDDDDGDDEEDEDEEEDDD